MFARRAPRSPWPWSQISAAPGRAGESFFSVEASTVLAQGREEREAQVSCRKAAASSAAPLLPSRGMSRVFTRPATGGFANTQMQPCSVTLPPVAKVFVQNTAHPRFEPGAVLQVGSALDRLGLRGVRMNYATQIADFHFLFDRENRFPDAFSRMRSHDCSAQKSPVFAVHIEAYMSFGFAIEDGAVGVGKFLGERDDLVAPLCGFLFGYAHVRDLRIRVRAPWDHQVAHPFSPEKQCVLDGDARHGFGGVCELVGGADVSGRIDFRIAGAEHIVHQDTGRICLDTRRFGVESLDVWFAANRNENLVDDNTLLLRASLQDHSALLAGAFRPEEFGAEEDADSFAFETPPDDLRGVPVIIGQQARAAHNNSDFAAEAPEGLCQLAANRSPADHEKGLGKGLEGKNCFIGEVA